MRTIVMKHGKETETTKEKHFALRTLTLHTINNGNALILMMHKLQISVSVTAL